MQIFRAAFVVSLMATTAFAVDGDALSKWREDLGFLRKELPERHRDLFHATSRDEFEKQIAAIERDLPALEDHEIIVRIARLMSIMRGDRDGHSSVPFHNHFSFLPVNFFLYSDGIHVRGAAKPYESLTGGRVVTIGGTAAQAAWDRVWTIAAGDNDQSRRADAALLLAIPELLRALRVASGKPAAPVEIVVEKPDGNRVTHSVTPVQSLDGLEWADVRRMSAKVPLYLRHANRNPFFWFMPEKALWFEHFPDQKALYVHYGAVADGPDETVAQFFARVFAFADSNDIRRFIVDLRHNGGGNNTLNRPFLHGMIKRDSTMGQRGRFFVLIGRHTFSAAQNIVTQLEAQTSVLFAGEPTGGAPNHYGDAARVVLPNSRVTVRASTLWWQDAHPADERLWIAPHIAADLSSADDRAGRDPALEAVLAYVPEPSLSEILRGAGPGGAAEAYAKWRSKHKYLSGEDEIRDLAVSLFREKKNAEALAMFELAATAHPQSWRAHEALGRAYQAAERNADAIAAYERAVALSGKAALSRERLAELIR
jgi:hypothetical protein